MGNAARKIELESTNSSSDEVHDRSMLRAIDRAQATIEFDTNGIVKTANENFCKATGYSLAEIQGKHHRMFCESEYVASPEYLEFWQKLRQGEFVSGEFKRIGRGGKELWLVASYCPITSETGELVGVVKLATDVTDSKKELQVRTDIMNLTSVVSEANLKGDIMSINDKYCELSQYSREELIGKPHNITRHPDMPKEVFKQLWSTIGKGGIFRGVVKNRKKDGTPYYVDAVIAPIMGDNGKPKNILVYAMTSPSKRSNVTICAGSSTRSILPTRISNLTSKETSL